LKSALIDYGFKYLTFPDYDVETERLKLEAWLYKIWNGEDPIELLRVGLGDKG